MPRIVRGDDGSAIENFRKLDVEWHVYRFPASPQVRGETFSGEEYGHWHFSRIQIEYRGISFIRNRAFPGLDGKQREYRGSGDRQACGSDGDISVRRSPVEFMQFSPRDQTVSSLAPGSVAAVDNDR
ncbi:MAG: hypothetical protein OXI01_04665 [Albidovulum sp.]|nr:hypothetical protein [Albidovulum sp.]